MQKRLVPKTFWLRLKEALKEAQKPPTQIYAADMVGVKQSSVSLWNKPGGVPELEKVLIFAKRLNVCVEWLYTGRGAKHPEPASDEYMEVLKGLWPRVPEDTKRDLIGAARLHAGQLPQPSEMGSPATSAVPAS